MPILAAEKCGNRTGEKKAVLEISDAGVHRRLRGSLTISTSELKRWLDIAAGKYIFLLEIKD